MPEQIAITKIRRDGGTQSRATLNIQIIDEYAAAMRRDEEFPPIKLIYTGEAYILVDGFHRVEAAIKAKLDTISADVEPGTLEDAQWASYAANPAHGLPRSSDDKRRAIAAALKHPKGGEKSDREIASHIRVDHKTVGAVRKQLIERGEIPQLEERIGADGKTYKVVVPTESMDNWKEKMNEWAGGFIDVDAALIKASDDLYLCIVEEWTRVLQQRYLIQSDYAKPRGIGAYFQCASFHQSWVDAAIEDGCKFQFVQLDDLPKIVQRFYVSAIPKDGVARNKFEPATVAFNVGDFVVHSGNLRQVVKIERLICVLQPVEEVRSIAARLNEILPYTPPTWVAGKKNDLHYAKANEFAKKDWKERYAAIKRWYTPDAILCLELNDQWITLGEDAESLLTTDFGAAYQSDDVTAYIIMNRGKERLIKTSQRPVVVYTYYGMSDVEKWLNKAIEQIVRRSIKQEPEARASDTPAASPVGENHLELQRDVLALLYELQEQRGGWIGSMLVNLNGAENRLVSAGRIIRMSRRAPSSGLLTWYQITPAGCHDIGREPLPVVPEPRGDEYPLADAKQDRASLLVRMNERLIEVRDLLREIEQCDPELHQQLSISYLTLRSEIVSAMGVQLEPERLLND